MLVTMKEILRESVAKRYAVGAFDTMDHVFTEAIIGAAEEANRPVILMIIQSEFEKPDPELFMSYLINRCKKATVPVALHLDHGSTYESCIKAIRYGCTSVMFDGSSLPIDENIAITRKIVDIAHICGVSVEAEIGHVAGHEGNMLEGNIADETAYTKVEDALRFYNETQVDALAVAIGTVHGVYKGIPKLDFDRLSKIREAMPIPLVMHGGSGLSPEDFKKAIACGINKINFFTGMNLAAGKAIKDSITDKKLTFTGALATGSNMVREVVKEHIGIFGTQEL